MGHRWRHLGPERAVVTGLYLLRFTNFSYIKIFNLYNRLGVSTIIPIFQMGKVGHRTFVQWVGARVRIWSWVDQQGWTHSSSELGSRPGPDLLCSMPQSPGSSVLFPLSQGPRTPNPLQECRPNASSTNQLQLGEARTWREGLGWELHSQTLTSLVYPSKMSGFRGFLKGLLTLYPKPFIPLQVHKVVAHVVGKTHNPLGSKSCISFW